MYIMCISYSATKQGVEFVYMCILGLSISAIPVFSTFSVESPPEAYRHVCSGPMREQDVSIICVSRKTPRKKIIDCSGWAHVHVCDGDILE